MRQYSIFIKCTGIVLLACLFLIPSCKKKEVPPADTRSFHLGVTPWPADFTVEEVNLAYSFIQNHCDLVAHHFDDGIPYEEALRQTPMPTRFQADLEFRKSKTPAGKKILLSVAPLNLNRIEKAAYSSFANGVPDSIKSKWRLMPFNDPQLVTAYVNYIIRLADFLQPAFINYAVESNSENWNGPDFELYLDFLRQVYNSLKTRYPSTPIFLSLMVSEAPAGLANAARLTGYSDYLALSAYPYTHISSSATGNTNPENFPAAYFDRFISLAPDKPLAFAETGYIAQRLLVPFYSLDKMGNEEWQNAYLEKILDLCKKKNAKFLVWFCHKDYDAANDRLRSLGLYFDLLALWQDTGFTDENGRQRPAYFTWLKWMAKPLSP